LTNTPLCDIINTERGKENRQNQKGDFKMTIREMITALEILAAQHGDDTRCTVYDEYTAEEGWGYQAEDLYIDATPEFDEGMQVIVIR
jgi:hypothetical protein